MGKRHCRCEKKARQKTALFIKNMGLLGRACLAGELIDGLVSGEGLEASEHALIFLAVDKTVAIVIDVVGAEIFFVCQDGGAC